MAENVGIYTDDSSLTLKINQYNGYQDLTCAQILEAIKNTDSYNENAIGFVAVPTSQEGYEIQAFNYAAGDLLSIWNCFPDWTLEGGDTNYIYWNVSNPTTVNVRSRQYYRAVFSSNKWSFSGYRDAYFGNHTYDGITYYGKGNNSTSLSYSHAVLYISNLSAFNEIYFNGNPLVTYTWQSVPSISGKNGILSLAQIKEEYINDGESVSGASADHFTNLSTENRVDVLIDDALPAPEIGGTTVTIKYTIPSLSTGSYEYCKLVAKKNSMPEGPEDGDKIIDIDPTSISASVKYLRGSTKYYFEIFVKTADGYEAVSNVKSITTGETTDIVLFTNEFNEDILVDDWDIATYRSGWGNGSSNWNPSQFTSDFLTAYNFLIGNSSKRTIYLGDGEITADQKTSMTDATFWIPINRSIIPETFKIEFDAKVSPIGSSDYGYNYTWVAVGCVDSNNNWHQSAYAGGIPGQDWVHYELEVTNWTYGYIDYIGLSDCDGKPHWKNVKVTVG